MQYRCIVLCLLACTACGDSSPTRPIDAALVVDAPPDSPPDAPPDAACMRTLLTGGTDVTTQGWTIKQVAPATVTNAADYVQLQTSTTSGQQVGGQLLLTYANAVPVDAPFKLQIVMSVQAVNAHNPLDSAAAILGGFTAPFGTGAERSQMIYVDSAAVGWADDSQTHAATSTDGQYHTYVLAVDALKTATLLVDGSALLARANYTTNGTIAVGDQTNDANVDSTLRIRSVTLLCP